VLLQRTLVELRHKDTEELEAILGRRLAGDPFLGSLLEELCWRQIEKEHLILETCAPDKVSEHQGIARGTRYFLDLRSTQIQKSEPLDHPGAEA
jgi:hypothetical protein